MAKAQLYCRPATGNCDVSLQQRLATGNTRLNPQVHCRRAVLQLWQESATYASGKCELPGSCNSSHGHEIGKELILKVPIPWCLADLLAPPSSRLGEFLPGSEQWQLSRILVR